jgi:hypothetical protein
LFWPVGLGRGNDLPNGLLCRSDDEVGSRGRERVSLLDLFEGQGPEGGDDLSFRQPAPQPADKITGVSKGTGLQIANARHPHIRHVELIDEGRDAPRRC